jgi:Rv2632c-like
MTVVMRELPEGWRVEYAHYRVPAPNDKTPRAKGGATVAVLYDAEGEFIVDGMARCHPRDNYCKQLGRTIALGRALKSLQTGIVE